MAAHVSLDHDDPLLATRREHHSMRPDDPVADQENREVVLLAVRRIDSAIRPAGLGGASLSVLVGARIGKGWSKLVRERLQRVDNCTHLVELLMPLATTALMGTRGAQPIAVRFPPGKRPSQMDTCYAWSIEREMVGNAWPEYSKKSVPADSPKRDSSHGS